MIKLKEMSCEELEQKRSSLAKFVFTDCRKLDTETQQIYINKLTTIENELETRYQQIQEIFEGEKDLQIIEYYDIIEETLSNYNNVWQYLD